jgi:hypothetical protein
MVAWLLVSALIAAAPDVAAPPFRVRLGDRATAGAVEAALNGASRRVARPECARVLSDFSDNAGRTLQQSLDALGLEATEYLRFVIFTDGGMHGSCARGRLAFTAPGSRVVFVCPQFREEQWQKPLRAEALLIHETLHTLGLSENPPSTTRSPSRSWRAAGAKTTNRHSFGSSKSVVRAILAQPPTFSKRPAGEPRGRP